MDFFAPYPVRAKAEILEISTVVAPPIIPSRTSFSLPRTPEAWMSMITEPFVSVSTCSLKY